ncbi:cysteine desulfurase NifS [Proteiniclasticum sp. QWL-01]|uniref:cysteine desulfurase NifS n=1 Tax=Proteiniclasticum sp. QWL-01 TaxID=3036945 RepID=UPI0024118D8F|nr:cysteine desulfurase NifS [Proteiniclasticum sp. QWL-01]WFF74481.1 cysteine desulfurase NifS [Proteiniclasticum sp. QWL-01]
MEQQPIIYMDNAATTKVKDEVIAELLPCYNEIYYNPSSIYSQSRRAKALMDVARRRVAKALNCSPDEVYFTGGGSEADNFAIKGIAFKNREKGNHIITTTIEHHAVLHTCQWLEKQGFEVTYLPVDKDGFVTAAQVGEAIRDNTILVSIMAANNEIGTIEPIAEIGALCREKKIAFHTDAVQAIGQIAIDVKAMNIDLLSLSGHKIHAPKGIGVLYVRKGLRIDNLVHGGAQERGRRAGTENVAGIVALGKAIEMATEQLEDHTRRMSAMRDRLIEGILQIPYSRLNGPSGDRRLSNNVNIIFEFIEGEGILLNLDFEGICASSGSACTSGSLDPSHVLLAIGLPHELAHGSLRLSLGDFNTDEEVEKVISVLPGIIETLRSYSPLWNNHLKQLKQQGQ